MIIECQDICVPWECSLNVDFKSEIKKKDTNEFICRTKIVKDFENKLMVTKQTYGYHTNLWLPNLWLPKGMGGGEGWTGGLGLTCAHRGTWNDWPMGTCWIAQGLLPDTLC